MKKILGILTILTLTLSMSVNAQTKKSQTETSSNFIAAGVFVSQDVAIENLEVGKTFGRNTIALVGQTYKVNKPSDRVWSTGVKYYRSVYKSGPFAVQLNGAVVLDLTNKVNLLTFKPGVSTSVNLTKNIGVQASLTSPIREGSTAFKPVNYEAGLQVVFTL